MKVKNILTKRLVPLFFLFAVIIGIYYKLFFLGKIPFPGDLLVVSYSPWFDYYKFPVHNPLISDVFSQFFLWKYLAVDTIRSGQWPLWNPYSFTGTPLLATYHSAALYPLNILLFLPKYFGWGLFIFSQTLLAATAMYLLLSLYIESKLARLTGATVFAFGGLTTTWLELGTAGHAIIWLPLSLYFIERYLIKFQYRYLLLLIISSTLLILAGHAQISTYSFIILLLYIIIKSLSKNLRIFSTSFFPPFFSLGLSLLINTPQLLPSLDLLHKSIRLTESYTGEFNFGLLPFKDSLKFFVADFFGNPVTRNYWGFLNYSETNGFLGTLTLPLILFSYIYLRKNRINIFFLSIFPLSLILTFDNYISHTIYQFKIPFLTSSYASRMLFITNFSTAFLSAFSINQIIKNQPGIIAFLRVTIWSWASLVGIAVGSILVHQIIQNFLNYAIANQKILSLEHIHFNFYDFYLKNKDFALSNFIISTRNCLLPILNMSAFLILFLLIRKIKLKIISRNQVFLICLTLFIILTFDLSRYFLKFNPFVAQKFIFPDAPALQFLQKQPEIFRVGREHAEVFPPNTWIAYHLYSIEGYDPLYLNSYAKFMHFLNGGDLRYGSSSRYGELSQKYDSPYIDLANVKYFIGIGRDRNGYIPGDLVNYHFNEAGYKKVFQDKSAIIFKNPNALERVFFAPSIITLPQSKIEDMIMTDKTFDPRKTIALSQDLGISSVTGKGSATITYYSPDIVKIKTDSTSEQVLILTDQYEEGWRVKIDNHETRISPANLIFRAIKIPAGKHEVIFNYYPQSFATGLKISVVTILLICISSFITVTVKRF